MEPPLDLCSCLQCAWSRLTTGLLSRLLSILGALLLSAHEGAELQQQQSGGGTGSTQASAPNPPAHSRRLGGTVGAVRQGVRAARGGLGLGARAIHLCAAAAAVECDRCRCRALRCCSAGASWMSPCRT